METTKTKRSPGDGCCIWRLTATLGLGVLSSGASAQYETDFESPQYTASPFGELLNGQQGWYRPTGAGISTDWDVYSYAGNILGIPQNPLGSDQFAGGVGLGGGTLSRAQVNVTLGPGVWTLAADVAVQNVGNLPTTRGIGSLSTQPGGRSARLIMIGHWANNRTAEAWNADMYHYTAAGNEIIGSIPDTGFQNLQRSHWYRWSSTFDFDSRRIIGVSIEDLSTGEKSVYNPTDWYLEGGSAAVLGIPTAIRMFAGGHTEVFGNVMTFDNVSITPGPSTCPCACDFDTSTGQGICDIFDFLEFQNGFVSADPCTCDIDTSTGSGVCDLFDFLVFQSAFVAGCP